MLQKIISTILSYAVFIGSHAILYTVFLRLLLPAAAAVLAFIGAFAAAILILLLVEKRFDVPKVCPYTGKVRAFQCIRCFWYGFWGLFGINCVLALIIPPAVWTEQTANSLAAVFSAVLLHPLLEEYLFRKLYFSRVENCLTHPTAALLVQAVLFSLTHYAAGAGNMLYALAGGMIFGLVYRYTGRLFIPILLHGTVNLSVLCLLHTGTFSAAYIFSVCILSVSVLSVSVLCYTLFDKRKKENRS